MRHQVVVAGIALSMSASVLSAQANSCPSGSPLALITQDGCQKAVDLFQYMSPQLGGAITGGNATLGQGGPVGGLGHFVIGVRANVVAGSLPQVQDLAVQPVFTGSRPTNYRTSDQIVP